MGRGEESPGELQDLLVAENKRGLPERRAENRARASAVGSGQGREPCFGDLGIWGDSSSDQEGRKSAEKPELGNH